jgi:hypothetical protein
LMARAISIDELFAEPFEPEWMTHKARLERQLWEYGLKYDADYRFRAEATRSRLRLSGRCDARGNYSNTPKTPATATGVISGVPQTNSKRKSVAVKRRNAGRRSDIIIS